MNQYTEELKASVTTRFVYCYNEIFRNNALRFVTPRQRHCCENIVIPKQQRARYEADKAQHPKR
jgi:hypothetical protein